MKIRIFSADFSQKVEAAVNAWLASLPSEPTLHLSDTTVQLVTSPNGVKSPLVTVTIWYSEHTTPSDRNEV